MKPFRVLSGKDAARLYRHLHWGASEGPPKSVEMRIADTTRPLVDLGALTAVEYATAKGADGFSVYRHDFGGDDGSFLPVLAVSADRRLVIAGGTYTVTKRGIIG